MFERYQQKFSNSRNAGLQKRRSLLPKYRGAAPIQWSVLNGDKNNRESQQMFMDAGMDTGDMILKKKLKLRNENNRRTPGTPMTQILCVQLLVEPNKLKLKDEVSNLERIRKKRV